ncbi:hypothetical protein S40293_01950 [Stachybotrys chartarum IBT 40293]|nr:hypothetical protein S40293_01950 [Stachybotrys chartarum IBT 40293]
MATPAAQDDPAASEQQQQQQHRPPPSSAVAPPAEPQPTPASPPLPPRHTAATPGPRAARLQELYAQSLRRTLAKLSWDNLAGCYPTVARRAEPVLRQVQAQMVEKLGDKCEKEFDNIMAARQVVPKLNDLESLVSEAAQRRAESSPSSPPTPPHLLPPSTILAAHRAPSLAAHQSQLNARLQTTQSRNAALFDEVRRQREEIDLLLAQLEAAVDDVKAANQALGTVVPQIAAEARQSHVHMAEAASRD